MPIAVVGSKGQLGQAIMRQLGSSAVGFGRSELDITQPGLVMGRLTACQPKYIINCAAYTEVDQAEEDCQRCAAVNADAVSYLVEFARQMNSCVVQISTDYVFGGDFDRRIPYREDDATAPQGIYAQTKVQGERNAAAWHKHIIVRSSGLYGLSARRNNFVEMMLRQGHQQGRVRVVNDQWCSPTYVDHLAYAVCFLVNGGHYGTYHVVNSGATSWYEFAQEIFQQAGLCVTVDPISTRQLGAKAARPAYSVLDTSKYDELGGPVMPSWNEALIEYLASRPAE